MWELLLLLCSGRASLSTTKDERMYMKMNMKWPSQMAGKKVKGERNRDLSVVGAGRQTVRALPGTR